MNDFRDIMLVVPRILVASVEKWGWPEAGTAKLKIQTCLSTPLES